ncbi:hypothetical protein EON63_16980 [archaeon]|nr:MAG: hypothetical protein EON63_16980 [archaeon]
MHICVSPGHRDYYTGNDVIRLIEPIGGTMLNFLVFYHSGIFKHDVYKRNFTCICLFILAAAVYNQGAGFHSCSNMFKNAMQAYDDDNFTNSSNFNELEYYVRTVWEHIVSHYIYAGGYVCMNLCQLYAYKNVRAPILGLPCRAKAYLIVSSGLYGLLVAAVAINFPSGLIVGLVYTIVLGIGGIGGYMCHQYIYRNDQQVGVFGARPVVHHFFLGCVVGLVLILIWIALQGGFKTRSEA